MSDEPDQGDDIYEQRRLQATVLHLVKVLEQLAERGAGSWIGTPEVEALRALRDQIVQGGAEQPWPADLEEAVESMTGLLQLIERSSLGTPASHRIRRLSTARHVAAILARAEELDRDNANAQREAVSAQSTELDAVEQFAISLSAERRAAPAADDLAVEKRWFDTVVERKNMAAVGAPSASSSAVRVATTDLWLDSSHAQDPEAHEDELLRDLATLRRGAGMDTPQLCGRLGPLLYGWCGIHRTADDREARREVRNAISTAIATFPADERLAVPVALGIAPGAQHVLLSDRVGVLADQLRVSERAPRRRIDQSFARLAGEIEAGTQRGDDEPDPGPGWSVQRLKALVRLDGPEPELIEERQIVATRDGLRRISAMFTVPPAEDGRDVERQVIADALHGARITDIELEGKRHFRWLLDLPRPLAYGETHTYSMAYRIRDDLAIRPAYRFVPLVPLVPCESFSVRIRFDRRDPPPVVWRVDGAPPSVFSEPPQPGTPLPVDSAGEVAQEFTGLQLGHAYGLRWLP